jgi:hypothetical protein
LPPSNCLDRINMEVAVLAACCRICLRQLDAVSFNMVNRAYMLVVRADHFHVLCDLGYVCH